MIRVFNQYISRKSVLCAVCECLLTALALWCGGRVRFWSSPAEFETYRRMPEFGLQCLLFVSCVGVCFYYNGLYDLSLLRGRRERLLDVAQALGATALLLSMTYFLFPDLTIGRGVWFISMALIVVFVMLNRAAMETVWRIAPRRNALILGAGPLAMDVARQIAGRPDLNLHLCGFVACEAGRQEGHDQGHNQGQDQGREPERILDYPLLGAAADLETLAESEQIDRIIVALEDHRGVLPVRELVRLRVQGVSVDDAHSTIAALSGRVWLRTVRPSWFVFSGGFHRSRWVLGAKRLLDLVFATAGLIVCLPIMALLAAAIRLESKGPAIFRQERVGYRSRRFQVLKFRSMRVDAEAAGARWAVVDDPRLTRLGGWLRKCHLDELPQFINVIRGDMSFVGPRPERAVFIEELRKHISYYDERHSVRPGLTGWAQVQYPYGASVEDAFRKLEYDLFYVKNMSVALDCLVLVKTVAIVLTGKGGR